MDISQAITQVGSEVILAGNLDPTSVFHSGTIAEVETQTSALMSLASPYKNFIISSGCDIPPHTPVENLDAFYRVVREYTL
jgi:uroporphyrinogen decarboxylase